MTTPARTPFTLDRWYQWRCIWTFGRRELRLWTYFQTSFVLDLLAVFTTFIIYMIMSNFRPVGPAEIYGGTYASFMVLGFIANTVLAAALSAPYAGLMSSWWSNRLEVLMMSPVNLATFVTGISIGEYIRSIVRVFIYALTGAVLFHSFAGFQNLSMMRVGLSLLTATLAIGACTGLGLLAASMVYLLDARGGSDPVRLAVETLSAIAGGVYFPLQSLPLWLQALASLIPQTYALDALRLTLLSADSGMRSGGSTLPLHRMLPGMPPVMTDLLVLAAYATVAMWIGHYSFERGLALARRDGRLSQWR